MNVLFLDVDGVLNGYHSIMRRLKNNDDSPNVDEEKVQILADICHELDLKVVISSSWKLGKNVYNPDTDDFEMSKWLKYLIDLLNKYEIDFIGFTPSMNKKINFGSYNMWKDDDIRFYLWKHPEVEHFVIIDDDLFDLVKLKDYVVQTNNYNDIESMEGITKDNINDIKMILKKDNKYKKHF